jgi:lysophospholipase L1-like esterase
MKYPIIHWAGDSTVTKNDINRYPQSGIGQYFELYLKPYVLVMNYAQNGRSTKSFIEEGRLKDIDDNIKPGDFLFIQFGHNDEKEKDPARFTTPFGTYQENLKKMIDVAREHWAYPLIITPLYRRAFNEDKVTLKENNHLDYPAAAIELAKREDVPYIDLCSHSKRFIEKAGFEGSKKWFMHLEDDEYYPYGKQEDNSHLRPEGAIAFGSIIAQMLDVIGGPYKDILIPLETAESYFELGMFSMFKIRNTGSRIDSAEN